MMQRPMEPNFIINNPPVNQFPAIIEKVSCPICFIVFQKRYSPMITCPSNHTICSNCLEGIIKKAAETPQNPVLCPMCRERIELPLKLNEEYTEFVKLLQAIGELKFGMTIQSNQLKKKSSLIVTKDKEIKKKNQDLFQMTRKMKIVEDQMKKLMIENKNLKKTISDLQQGMKKRDNTQTDAQGEQKVQRKNRIELQKPGKIPNKQVDIDKRPPLKQLFYNEELGENNDLNLMRKGFTMLQMEFLAFHDMSTLIKLDLACNLIDNSGFDILITKSNLTNLTNLIVANNRITELPMNIEVLTKLEYFNIGNYVAEDRKTCNRLRELEFEKMLAQKWEVLRNLDVEFDTDAVWDNDEDLDKLVAQWPLISRINICTFTMKMTKKKCQHLHKTLNLKAKRPMNMNRILVAISNNQH